MLKKTVTLVITSIFVLMMSLTGFAKDISLNDSEKQFEVEYQTIDCAELYTMGIRSDGSLWAWGDGYEGELGNGMTKIVKPSPIKIMTDVVSVSTKYNHTMAIKSDGSLWGWGHNTGGQIGDGTTVDRYKPVKIMDNAATVSAGGEFTMVIRTDGSLWAWGYNGNGELGDGTTVDKHRPVKIMDDVISVSAGTSHTLAIKKDGSLWGWGSNEYSQLGDDTKVNILTPVKLMDDVKLASAGSRNTLLIMKDNSLWGCGSFIQNGGGDNSFASSKKQYTFEKIMDDVVYADSGILHQMAIKSDGSLWGWGRNYDGQIGNGNKTDISTPVKIMDGVVTVSAGWMHTMAVKKDGTLWGWGFNGDGEVRLRGTGELGDGTYNDRIMPVKILNDIKLPDKKTVVKNYLDNSDINKPVSVQLPMTLRMITQPNKEYTNGERISFVVQGNSKGKVEYRVTLYNGTTKKTTELWKTPKTGYYYRNWQPKGTNEFTIGWPVVGMEPGYYSLSIYSRTANGNKPYEEYVTTQSFYVK